MNENLEVMCRLCIQNFKYPISIFSNGEPTILEMIVIGTGLDIDQNDGLPQNVCSECLSKIEFIYQNKKKFLENDAKLRKVLTKQNEDIVNDEIIMNETILQNIQTIEVKVIEDEKSQAINEILEDLDHTEDNSKANTIFKRKDNRCFMCNESFSTSVILSEHFTVHLDRIPYRCIECVQSEVVIKTLSSLNLHLKMHRMPFKCNFCDNRYSSVNARKTHETSIHYLNKKKKQSIKCDICGKNCISERSHKEHLKIHNNEYQCKVCLKSFMSSTVLKRHEILHSGAEKPYACKICPQKFNHASNYKTHLKRHTKEKPHQCCFCPASFLISNYLKDHVKIHHSAANEFVPKRNLTDQYSCTVVDPNKREYKCKTCGKVFPSSTHITHHLKTHNKAHQCSHCGRRFKDSRALLDHENIHTGSKPHLCKTCGKAFANSSNLYQHNKIHTGVKNHVCHLCEKAFTYRENLKTHIRVHHCTTTEKPYDCIICSEKFIDSVSLKKHKEIHTEIFTNNDKN